MLADQALATKSDDVIAQNLIRLTGAVLGARRAIRHIGAPTLLEALNPARHDLGRAGIDAGGLRFGERTAENGDSHFLSTQRGQSGILVDVHSEPSWKTEVW